MPLAGDQARNRQQYLFALQSITLDQRRIFGARMEQIKVDAGRKFMDTIGRDANALKPVTGELVCGNQSVSVAINKIAYSRLVAALINLRNLVAMAEDEKRQPKQAAKQNSVQCLRKRSPQCRQS